MSATETTTERAAIEQVVQLYIDGVALADRHVLAALAWGAACAAVSLGRPARRDDLAPDVGGDEGHPGRLRPRDGRAGRRLAPFLTQRQPPHAVAFAARPRARLRRSGRSSAPPGPSPEPLRR